MTIAALTTERECRQATQRFVDDLEEGRHEARADVEAIPPTQSFARAVDLDALPVNEALTVKSAIAGGARGSYVLEDRGEVREVIEDVRSQLTDLSQRV